MIPKLIAVVIVVVAVLGPGSYLFQVAWNRGGTPRRVAVAICVAMSALVAWLFAPRESDLPIEKQISQFAGAWGMLFMIVGLVVCVAAVTGRFRPPEPPEPRN